MAANDKTKRMPLPKTEKLDRQAQASVNDQTELKRSSTGPKHANTAGAQHEKKSKKDRKVVALVVVIVLLVAALSLALCWGFGLFNPQEEPSQDQTEQVEPETEPEEEIPAATDDATDVAYTRYATGDIALEYPTNWSVMTYQGAQTVVVTRGTVVDGYVKLANASVSSYGASSVDGVSTMKSFIKAVADSENIQVDVDSLSVSQRGDVWLATIPMSGTTEGVNMKGSQLIAATGNTAYIVTAQCPTTTYHKNWPYFDHILDSISFNASAEFPDEGRD